MGTTYVRQEATQHSIEQVHNPSLRQAYSKGQPSHNHPAYMHSKLHQM
jgi:hypothetical protein